MFNFNNFPNLKKCHIQYERCTKKIYKYDCPSDSKKERKIFESIENVRNYEKNIYAKEIFDVFSHLKPVLTDRRTKTMVKWEKIFKDDFNKFSDEDKEKLVLLIEEYGSLYRLPEEYYLSKK